MIFSDSIWNSLTPKRKAWRTIRSDGQVGSWVSHLLGTRSIKSCEILQTRSHLVEMSTICVRFYPTCFIFMFLNSSSFLLLLHIPPHPQLNQNKQPTIHNLQLSKTHLHSLDAAFNSITTTRPKSPLHFSLTKLSTAEGQNCGHKNVMVKINVFESRDFSILCNLPQADDALHC